MVYMIKKTAWHSSTTMFHSGPRMGLAVRPQFCLVKVARSNARVRDHGAKLMCVSCGNMNPFWVILE